jgi:glucokinase
LQALWRRYDRVSLERVLSGTGLSNLYWANCCIEWQVEGQERELMAPEVTAGAIAGDLLCQRAVNDFLAILGSVAGDVALMMGATGGVYISGGIVPRLLGLLRQDEFRQRFEDKGRYSEICSRIPLAIALAEHVGLRGCVVALRQGLS